MFKQMLKDLLLSYGPSGREDAAAADPVRVVRDCARRIRRFECKQQIDALTQRLSGGTLPAAEREALMQQIQQLTRQLRG
mgnify:CR=1 FL=1